MKTHYKQRVVYLITTMLVTLLSTAGLWMMYPATHAEDVSSETKTVSCIQKFRPYANAENIKFAAFMDQHFSNESSDSTLLPTAIVAYRSFREHLRAKFEELANSELYATQSEQISQRLTCHAELIVQYNLAEQSIKSHARKTSYIKKTTALTQKLSEINGKMRTLNRSIGELKGYFDTFAQKLPGYLKDCLQQ